MKKRWNKEGKGSILQELEVCLDFKQKTQKDRAVDEVPDFISAVFPLLFHK